MASMRGTPFCSSSRTASSTGVSDGDCRRAFADQQRDLALHRRTRGELRANFVRRPAQKLFVQLGQLARDHHRTVAVYGRDVGQRVQNPVWRFVEDQRARFSPRSSSSAFLALACLRRQKAAESKRIGRQARRSQRAQHRRGAGYRHHRDPRARSPPSPAGIPDRTPAACRHRRPARCSRRLRVSPSAPASARLRCARDS